MDSDQPVTITIYQDPLVAPAAAGDVIVDGVLHVPPRPLPRPAPLLDHSPPALGAQPRQRLRGRAQAARRQLQPANQRAEERWTNGRPGYRAGI